MAPGNLVITIGFTEANSERVVNALCDRFGLERSEANAKVALKKLAIVCVHEMELADATREAEAKPEPV